MATTTTKKSSSPGGLAGILDTIGSALSSIAGLEGQAAQGYVTTVAPTANVAGEQGAATAVTAGGTAAGATVSAAGAVVGSAGTFFALVTSLDFWKGIGLVLAGALVLIFGALELRRLA
jgi:hypothetical protein